MSRDNRHLVPVMAVLLALLIHVFPLHSQVTPSNVHAKASTTKVPEATPLPTVATTTEASTTQTMMEASTTTMTEASTTTMMEARTTTEESVITETVMTKEIATAEESMRTCVYPINLAAIVIPLILSIVILTLIILIIVLIVIVLVYRPMKVEKLSFREYNTVPAAQTTSFLKSLTLIKDNIPAEERSNISVELVMS